MGLESIFRLIGQYKDQKQNKVDREEERKLREAEMELSRGRLQLGNEQLGMERQGQQRLLGMDNAAGSWANRMAFNDSQVLAAPQQDRLPFPQPQGLEALLPTAQKAMEANMLFGAAPKQQDQRLQLLEKEGLQRADWMNNPQLVAGLASMGGGEWNASNMATANQGMADQKAGVYGANAQQEVAKALLGTTLAQHSNERMVANKDLGDAAFTQKMVQDFSDSLLGANNGVWTNPRLQDGAINMNIEQPPTPESEMMKSLMGEQEMITLSSGIQIPVDSSARSHRFAPSGRQPATPTAPAPEQSVIAKLLGTGASETSPFSGGGFVDIPTAKSPNTKVAVDSPKEAQTMETVATPEELTLMEELKASQFISDKLKLRDLISELEKRLKLQSPRSMIAPQYSVF